MFEDFELGGDALNEIQNPPPTAPQHNHATYNNSNPAGYSGAGTFGGGSSGHVSNNSNGYGGNGSGGYSNNQGGGGQRFQRKPEVIEEPYKPVTVYINRDFPEEVKENLLKVVNRLVSKGYTVRYNAEEPEIHNRIQAISKKNTEAYLPWKGFNDLESKHYWNTLTAKHIAQTNFIAWEKVPNAVQAMLARDVRTLFGDRNNSVTMGLITWSPDGVETAEAVTKETGRASFIIKLAAKYNFDVTNIAREGAANTINRKFIGGDVE